MGNQPTTARRVTFEREQTGLIAISDSVAKRLRSGELKSIDESTSHQARSSSDAKGSSRSPSETKNQTSPEVGESASSVSEHQQPQLRPQYFVPHVPQEEHVIALKKLEEHWQERYKRLESDAEHVRKASAEEFQKAVKQLEGMFEKKRYNIIDPDLEKAVTDCYKQNTTRTLQCSREADAFIKGVENYKTGFFKKQIA